MLLPVYRLLNAIKASLVCTSTDETRTHLNAILFEVAAVDASTCGTRSRTTLRLVATDGHRLVISDHAADTETTDTMVAGSTCLLRRSDAVALVRLLSGVKAAKNMPPRAVDVSWTTGEGAEIKVSCGSFTTSYKSVDAKFPPYAQVVPESCTNGSGKEDRPALQAQYLAEACDVLALLTVALDGDKRRVCPVNIDHSAELDPLVVSSPNLPHALIVVMPTRTDSFTPFQFAAKIKGIAAPEVEEKPRAKTLKKTAA